MHATVLQWAAWAPGVTSIEAWHAWAKAPWCPVGTAAPELKTIPPLQRRRLDAQGRLPFAVTAECAGQRTGRPVVAATRHGEAQRSVELLSSLARAEPMSPTSFALSVHNAVAGQIGILRSDTANVVAVANGPCTAEAGFLEACGLLNDGADEVLLTVYDASWPSVFERHRDEPNADFAWCFRLGRGLGLSLTHTGITTSSLKPALPHGLAVWHWWLSDAVTLEVAHGWRWQRA